MTLIEFSGRSRFFKVQKSSQKPVVFVKKLAFKQTKETETHNNSISINRLRVNDRRNLL